MENREAQRSSDDSADQEGKQTRTSDFNQELVPTTSDPELVSPGAGAASPLSTTGFNVSLEVSKVKPSMSLGIQAYPVPYPLPTPS